jgi:di/tricarboxylate transporter
VSLVALASTVTEFNSNAAACSMLLPVVAELAVALQVLSFGFNGG